MGDDLVLQIPPLRRPWTIFTRAKERRGVPVMILRQFLPSFGWLMVCGVTITEGSETILEQVGHLVHNCGAAFMFLSYIVFEFHALWLSPIVKMSGREKKLRKIIIIVCFVFSVGFEMIPDLLLPDASPEYSCAARCQRPTDLEFLTAFQTCSPFLTTCTDQWVVPSKANLSFLISKERYGSLAKAGDANERQKVMLLNTADGWVLFVKQLTYWCEVLAGLTLLFSHFVIWWFAPERPHNFLDELLDMRRYLDLIRRSPRTAIDLGRLRRLDLVSSRQFFLERASRSASSFHPFPMHFVESSIPLLT